MTWTEASRAGRHPTNGTTIPPAVLCVLFLRRHGWTLTTIARATGRSKQTIQKQLDTAAAVLGVSRHMLDVVLVKGGELRKKIDEKA